MRGRGGERSHVGADDGHMSLYMYVYMYTCHMYVCVHFPSHRQRHGSHWQSAQQNSEDKSNLEHHSVKKEKNLLFYSLVVYEYHCN